MISIISNISKLCQYKIVISLELSSRCESWFCKILFFCPKCKPLSLFWSKKIDTIYLIWFYSGFQNCIDLLHRYCFASICLWDCISRMTEGSWLHRFHTIQRDSFNSRMTQWSWLYNSWVSCIYEAYAFLTIPISSRFYTRCCLILCAGS